MDIPRPVNKKAKWLRRIAIVIVVLGSLAGIMISVSRLKPAVPSVEGNSVWTGTVERGTMVREVRGVGTLVPEELLWVPARTSGRVERKLMLPGARSLANASRRFAWQSKARTARCVIGWGLFESFLPGPQGSTRR